MAIYILTHRPIKNWDTRFYTPIHMSTLDNPDVKIQIKDIYPKLAEMNLLYNEHSASYYIWKKDKGPIKGMVQYRMLPKLTESQIKDILKEKDFILHTDYVQNLAWQFKRCHDPESRMWDIVMDEVKKTGLDELTLQRWCNSAIVFSRNTIPKAFTAKDGSKAFGRKHRIYGVLRHINHIAASDSKSAAAFTLSNDKHVNIVRKWHGVCSRTWSSCNNQWIIFSSVFSFKWYFGFFQHVQNIKIVFFKLD